MPLHQSSRFENIGRLLRTQFGQIADEPLPKRWVDLIKHLNERERAENAVDTPAPKTTPDTTN